MKVRIVVTLSAASKDDAMKLPRVLEAYQGAMENNRQQGMFGPTADVEVHFLVKPGRWE